jgi:hypothetical protein
MRDLVVLHLLDDGAAARVGRRQSIQVVLKV